jgi:hypothetical protein
MSLAGAAISFLRGKQFYYSEPEPAGATAAAPATSLAD